MKRVALVTLMLAAGTAWTVAGCGKPYEEPVPLEREISGEQGDPPKTKAPIYVPDAGEFVFPDAGCCPVRFALAYQGEVAVSLFGFAAPFQPDVPMTLDGGAWETTICMRLSTQVYGYRSYLQPDVGDGGLFEAVTYNPNAPAVQSVEYGLLNEFRVPEDAGTCGDVDALPHGDTTIPDAGP